MGILVKLEVDLTFCDSESGIQKVAFGLLICHYIENGHEQISGGAIALILIDSPVQPAN